MRRALFEADHESFRGSVRAFLDKQVVPHYPQWEAAGTVPRELFTAVGELGLFAVAVPERFGGAGLRDFRYAVVTAEEAARAAVAPAMLGPLLQANVCLPYLLHQASDEQQSRWLPGVATGELITAIAMTEPGAGSDLAGIATSAVLDGDDYVVNGAKTFITNGINADLVITAVRTDPVDRHRGLSLLVIQRDTPGFTRGRNLDKVGMHAQDTAELAFTDARVPAANLLGAAGDGFAHLVANLPQERLGLAVDAVAGAAAALDWTLEYVRERTAFGSPIGSFQNTRFALAEVATEVDVTRTFVDACVLAHGRGELSAVDAAKAKWWATEMQSRVVDTCLQLHGGYGYMLEYPIARAFVDSRVHRIYGGTTEIMKEIIGRDLGLR
jgi:alkylation response protein AidB-like acyl-CoA dehydrogenase